MTNFRNLFTSIFILTGLLSCGGRQTDNHTSHQETPEALQDNKIEIKRYRSSSDLTEELYQELVDKTPALKKLENDLEAFGPKPGDLQDKFNKFDSKSNSYYRSAHGKAWAISDSLLKKKMMSLIAKSETQYSGKTAELNSLLKQISKTGATLNDHHRVLKIVLTLPIIEKYQDDNRPDKKEFKDLMNQREQLILQIDSLTPGY